MISGRKNPDLAPLVPVGLLASDGEIHTTGMALDTGFNGDLALPKDIIRRLGFQLFDDITSRLADGQEVRLRGWEGTVIWHGRPRRIVAVEAGNGPIPGMNLLWLNRITVGVHANSPVTIEELNQ